MFGPDPISRPLVIRADVDPQPTALPPKSIWRKILNVVIVIFALLLGVVFFIYSPIVFLVSFIVGIACAGAMKKAMSKLIEVWRNKPWIVIVTAIGFYVLGLTAALLVTTSLIGIYLGTELYQWSTHRVRRHASS